MNTAALYQLADRELSVKSRIGHVALLLASLAMAVVVGSQWVTEPKLPLRTEIALAAMTVIGLCWAVFATWVLAARRVLLAVHGVVAARMAVLFSGAALSGAVLLALVHDMPAAWMAAGLFALMLATAAMLLLRTQRRLRELQQRRAELERRLTGDRRT
jgi:hypothetical protein